MTGIIYHIWTTVQVMLYLGFAGLVTVKMTRCFAPEQRPPGPPTPRRGSTGSDGWYGHRMKYTPDFYLLGPNNWFFIP